MASGECSASKIRKCHNVGKVKVLTWQWCLEPSDPIQHKAIPIVHQSGFGWTASRQLVWMFNFPFWQWKHDCYWSPLGRKFWSRPCPNLQVIGRCTMIIAWTGLDWSARQGSVWILCCTSGIVTLANSSMQGLHRAGIKII